MKLDTDEDKHIVIPFLRVPKPMAICIGIPVSSIWSVVSTKLGTENALCKLDYRHVIGYRCTLGYCDSFFQGVEANGHL